MNAVHLSIFTLFCFRSSCVSLSYFNLFRCLIFFCFVVLFSSVSLSYFPLFRCPMRKCSGEHSCLRSSFFTILNGSGFFALRKRQLVLEASAVKLNVKLTNYSCCSHAHVLGTAIVHEFHISYSHTECYFIFSVLENKKISERRAVLTKIYDKFSCM